MSNRIALIGANASLLRCLILAGALSVIAGCGGGGGGDTTTQSAPPASTTPPPTDTGVSDAAVIVLASDTPEEVRRKTNTASRFLHQATFGANEADIKTLQAVGFSGWFARQLAKPAGEPVTLAKVSGDARFDATLDNGQARTAAHATRRDQIWRSMVAGDDQLRQRVAFALSQIFVVSTNSSLVSQRPLGLADYYDMLGRNAFGNFRKLLEDVSLHPVMGVYLSHAKNQKEDPATGRVPDENYAREVMQLFTIGLVDLNQDGTPKPDGNGRSKESYTNNDVTGLAKVFTGWSWGGASTTATNFAANRYYYIAARDLEAELMPMKQYPAFHSLAEKKFLGTVIPANTNGVDSLKIALDALFNHANTGPFIGKQLIQRLVTSNPSPAYVSRVAAKFGNNGRGVRGDMAAVLQAVLLDPEARDDDRARSTLGGGKLREPVVRLTNWARAFEATAATLDVWESIASLTDVTQSTGQLPLQSPSVFNFYRPGYTPPGSAVARDGMVAPEFQITTEVTTAGYSNLIASRIFRSPSATLVASGYAKELALASTPDQLLDRIDAFLTGGLMTDSTRSRILAEVNAIDASTSANRLRRVQIAILLTMHSPEYLVQR